jgi:hypothetical protein
MRSESRIARTDILTLNHVQSGRRRTYAGWRQVARQVTPFDISKYSHFNFTALKSISNFTNIYKPSLKPSKTKASSWARSLRHALKFQIKLISAKMNPKDANGSTYYFLVLPNFIDRRSQLIQVQVWLHWSLTRGWAKTKEEDHSEKLHHIPLEPLVRSDCFP